LAPRLREELARSAEERAYRKFLAACIAAGMPRLPAEGPRDHAQRVAERLPAIAEAVRSGATAWLEVHYGAPGVDLRDARQRLSAAARAVRTAAKKS